jgi:hypothetical protein
LEEDNARLCGDPSHQHESASRYGQHQERARNDDRHFDGAKGVFLARRESLPGLVEESQTFELPARKDTSRRDDSHGGLLFPPERDEHGPAFELCKGKPSLPTPRIDLLDQARVFILNVVDPGTDLPGNERSL